MGLYPIRFLSFENKQVKLVISVGTNNLSDSDQVISFDKGWKIRYIPHHLGAGESAPIVYYPSPPESLAPIQVWEQTEYTLQVEGPRRGTFCVECYEKSDLFRCRADPNHTQFWGIINWGNFVGRSEIRVLLNGRMVTGLPLEVRSRKMGYLDDYRRMLDDISERVAAVIFDFGSPTAVYHQRVTLERSIAYLDYLFVRYLMNEDRLPLHFRIVAANPHRTVHRETIWSDLSQVRSFGPKAMVALFSHPEYLTRPLGDVAPALQQVLRGYVPVTLCDDCTMITFDTPPNRFVKHFLVQLARKLSELRQCFGDDARLTHLVADCQRWQREVAQLSRVHFLEGVGDMHLYPAGSQVLLKQEGYRQINDYYHQFLLTGKVKWEGFEDLIRAPNKDLSTLYEYWCFFQIVDAVAEVLGEQVRTSDFVVLEGGTFRVCINRGGKTQAKLGEACVVYYNRYFRRSQSPQEGTYSVSLHPDYVLDLGDRLIVLDAKYRYGNKEIVHAFEEVGEGEIEADEEQGYTFRRADLYKMHTYRDAIKGAQSAFILYPGTEFRAFQDDGSLLRSADELNSGFQGVGAIPLNVRNPRLLTEVVARLILDRVS